MNERLVKGESNTNVPYPMQDLDSANSVAPFSIALQSQQGKSKPNLIQAASVPSAANLALFQDNRGRYPPHKQSAADLEMVKRLKRLEKFEQQQSLKAKIKPRLLNTTTDSLAGNLLQEETLGMDLNEMAKHLTIKGTCMIVEKFFYRLTSAPDPAEVRPEAVLKQALKLLKSKWDEKKHDYKFIDDQFRSLRQDMTIQRIQNDFCVKVYETHARIALSNSDLD